MLLLDFRKRIDVVPATMANLSTRFVVKISIMAAVLFLAVETGDVSVFFNCPRKLVYYK
jgi:hypothetical protein